MPEAAVRPLGAASLGRMLRFAARSGTARLHLAPGCAPLCVRADGRARPLRHRPLTAEDTAAAARLLLERTPVPRRLAEAPAEGGQALYVHEALRGEALLEVAFHRAEAGLALRLDVVRPVREPELRALLPG